MRFGILCIVGAVLASPINAAKLQDPRELSAPTCTVDHSLLDSSASGELMVIALAQTAGAGSLSTFSLSFLSTPPWGLTSPNILAWCVDTSRELNTGAYQFDTVSHVEAGTTEVEITTFLKSLNWLVNNIKAGDYLPMCDKIVTFDEIQFAMWDLTVTSDFAGLLDISGTPYEEDECVTKVLTDMMRSNTEYETDCFNPSEVVGVIMSVDGPMATDTTITHQVIFAEIPVSEAKICDCGDDQNGGVGGDPHFKTWTGGRYDYHGICDMILLQNPHFSADEHDVDVHQQYLQEDQAGMDIHIRTVKTKQWSYISSAVLRIGEETFEVTTEEGNEPKYFLNKVERDDLSKGLTGFSISSVKKSQFQLDFVVDLGASGTITFRTFKKMIRVDVHALSDDAFGSSLGLMGQYGSGRWMARDRKTVMEDVIEFGMEWQVLPEEPMLFHKVAGPQAPNKCEVPSASASRRRLLDSSITLEEARIACSRVDEDERDMCIFDVLAMDDKDVAGAY